MYYKPILFPVCKIWNAITIAATVIVWLCVQSVVVIAVTVFCLFLFLLFPLRKTKRERHTETGWDRTYSSANSDFFPNVFVRRF